MQKKNQTVEQQDVKSKKMQFTAEKVIGNGTFGVVYEAKIADTGEKVAIKKVFQDKRYKNRELEIIQQLHHPNCIQLKHAFYTTQEANKVFLNLVTDFLPENLYKITKQYFKAKQPFPPLVLKLYSYQMFRAIAYLHGLGICHRDMKPQNVLVDPQTYLLKLCDFGSAKKLVKGEQNIAYICSRYYRAPELIFGATQYTTQIDIWSTACVIAESVLGYPLFPGDSAVDQLIEILKVLGTPSNEEITAMNPSNKKFNLPTIKSQAWASIFPKNTDKLFIDFISKVLIYNPDKRYLAIETLTHPFFDELRQQNQEFHKHLDLFNFTQEELSLKSSVKDILIPKWYKQQKVSKLNNGALS